MYHSIGSDAFFAVSFQEFEKQMQVIAESGLRVVSLRMLLKTIQEGGDIGGMVALTFDDGYQDNLLIIPVLQKHQFRATIFVTTGLLGSTITTKDKQTLPLMDEGELRTCVESGVIDVMPHTRNHRRLTSIEPLCAREEIEGSVADIIRLTRHHSELFAYPAGKTSPAVVEMVRDAGFDGAVGVTPGTVGLGDDVYVLKRNAVDSSTTKTQFLGKLSCAVDVYERLKGLIR